MESNRIQQTVASITLERQNFTNECTPKLRTISVTELVLRRVQFDDKNMEILLNNLPINVEKIRFSFCKMDNTAFNALLKNLSTNTTVKSLIIEDWQNPSALATTIDKKVLEFLDHNTTIEKIEMDSLDGVAVAKKIKARSSKLGSSPSIESKVPAATNSAPLGPSSHANIVPQSSIFENALKFVLEKNSSLNLIDQTSGESLAHMACSAANLPLLKMISSCGHLKPLLDTEDKQGKTPLSIALTSRNNELINYLLNIGARHVGCAPLLELLKNTRKDSLEWTIATKCGLGRWTEDQFKEFYSQLTDNELRLRLLTCSVLRPLTSSHSQLIASLALKSYLVTRLDEFKTVFDVVELSNRLKATIFVRSLIEAIKLTDESKLLDLQSFVATHFTALDGEEVREYYNNNYIIVGDNHPNAKLLSYMLLCGTPHFQSLMSSCRAMMRATIDWLEASTDRCQYLVLLLGPITAFPRFDTSYQLEGGTAMVYRLEGRPDLVCKRTALYKSFVHEAIAMKIYSKSPHLMTFVSLHWDEQKTLFGITMQRMDSDLQQELSAAGRSKQLMNAHEIVECIVKGMIDMHRAGFAHLDIKPGNVLVSRNPLVVKIADFGTAHFDSDVRDKMFTVVSSFTPSYAPPEVLNQRVTREYIQQVDAYSFGLLLERVLNYCSDQTLAHIMTLCKKAECSERPTFEDILKLLRQARDK